MIRLSFNAYELLRVIEAMESLPQNSSDKDLMLKLWAAKDRLPWRKHKRD